MGVIMIDNGSPRINLSKQVKEKAVRDLVSFNEFTLYRKSSRKPRDQSEAMSRG